MASSGSAKMVVVQAARGEKEKSCQRLRQITRYHNKNNTPHLKRNVRR